MKKVIVSILVIVMAFSIMTGCQASGASSKESSDGSTESIDDSMEIAETAATEAEAVKVVSEEELKSAKTIGDLIAMEGLMQTGTASYEEQFVYAFETGGTDYRAVASITKEQADDLASLDFDAEDFDEQYRAKISPLEISRIENLTEGAPTQEELDAYVGKTGQDLLDEGWLNAGYDLDAMEFFMDHKEYGFTVVFDGKLDVNEVEEIGEDEAVAPLTIKSITYNGISDCTYLEEAQPAEGEEEIEYTDGEEFTIDLDEAQMGEDGEETEFKEGEEFTIDLEE